MKRDWNMHVKTKYKTVYEIHLLGIGIQLFFYLAQHTSSRLCVSIGRYLAVLMSVWIRSFDSCLINFYYTVSKWLNSIDITVYTSDSKPNKVTTYIGIIHVYSITLMHYQFVPSGFMRPKTNCSRQCSALPQILSQTERLYYNNTDI